MTGVNERAALLELHDWDELVFGGFYCLHCTPDDEDSLDDPIAWPCTPLRDAGVTDDEARAIIQAHREKVEAEYQAKKAAEQAELQRRVEEFNARYRVGTPVLAYPGARPEDHRDARHLVTRTRSKASVLGGHTDVVWVEGHSACIALRHVDVITEAEWQAAQPITDLATAVRELGALPMPAGPEPLNDDGFRDDVRVPLDEAGWRETPEGCVAAENGALWTETNDALDSGIDAPDKSWSVAFDSDVPASIIVAAALAASGLDVSALRAEIRRLKADNATLSAALTEALDQAVQKDKQLDAVQPAPFSLDGKAGEAS